MSAVQQQQHQSSIVSPEEFASAMNAAFAEFLAVEPAAAAAAALLIHHQQNVNPTTLNDFLTNGTTHNNSDLSRSSRPPTPYAVTTHTYSGNNFFFRKYIYRCSCFRFTLFVKFIIIYNNNNDDNNFTTL
jgi:hypothetical protein